MDTCRKLIINEKLISWLLVAAIFFITFLSVHYHLDHSYNEDLYSVDVIQHNHVIDLHSITDAAGQPHHNGEVSNIMASPDGIVKKSNPAFSPFFLFIIVFSFLPLLYKTIRTRINRNDIELKQNYPYFSPLLRAPPLF